MATLLPGFSSDKPPLTENQDNIGPEWGPDKQPAAPGREVKQVDGRLWQEAGKCWTAVLPTGENGNFPSITNFAGRD